MSRRHVIFRHIQQFIKNGDHTSIDHILRWEYRKEELFHMKNDDGLTLIHIACFEGQFRCLDVFLRNGASVHIRSSVGWTPLHAATLGGKIEVVTYLLCGCSADPFAKDDMGCLASDLTMDKEILETLNKSANDIKIKKDIEALAAKMEISKRKTNSLNLTIKNASETATTCRAQSMYVNPVEAQQIRMQYAKSKMEKSSSKSNYLQVPKSRSYSDTNRSSLLRHNSEMIHSTHLRSKSSTAIDSKEDHNAKIMQRKLSSSSTNSPNSPILPRAVKFFTRETGQRRSKETRNRDSGVFDDEVDCDNNEQSVTASKRETPREEHYNVI